MKKLTLLFAFFLMAGLTSVMAQSEKSCSKTCTKAEQAACNKAKASMAKADVTEAAAVAASMDETIEAKTCPVSGKVSYAKKSVCEKSGKVSYANVEYDAATGQFVSLKEVTEASTTEKKACSSSAKMASGAGCCSKAKAKASASTKEVKVSAKEDAKTSEKGA